MAQTDTALLSNDHQSWYLRDINCCYIVMTSVIVVVIITTFIRRIFSNINSDLLLPLQYTTASFKMRLKLLTLVFLEDS